MIFFGSLMLGVSLASSVPSLDMLRGAWVNQVENVSVEAGLEGNARDLPVLSNFWGSVGIGEQGVRPFDLVGFSALEMSPFTGCGNGNGTTFGCGALFVNGEHIDGEFTQWSAYEVGRRGVSSDGCFDLESWTRLGFEEQVVMVNLSIVASKSCPLTVELDLFGPTVRLPSVGDWVFMIPSLDIAPFESLVYTSKNVLGVSTQGGETNKFGGHNASSVLGVLTGGDLSWNVTKSTVGGVVVRGGKALMEAGQEVSLQVVFGFGRNMSEAETLVEMTAEDFEGVWGNVSMLWEERWEKVFAVDGGGLFSGNLPILEMGNEEVERVYYMSILSVFLQLRTNLPVIADRVFVNGEGNGGYAKYFSIGGATSWIWDMGLSSGLLSLLEPKTRPAMLQAWLTRSLNGDGNHMALDCSPPGSESCTHSPNDNDFDDIFPPVDAVSDFGAYPYSPWGLFRALSNHIRINNDSQFLNAVAGTSKNTTVDQVLEQIATSYQALTSDVFPYFADWGSKPLLDGFSDTYIHVIPGVQGNFVWMLRILASLRSAQGRDNEAASLESAAKSMATESINVLYAADSQTNHGFFNILWPNTTSPNSSTLHEYRHILDFFSMTIGTCGFSDTCFLSPLQKQQLSNWLLDESITSSWIRATSPYTNCSNSWTLQTPYHPPSPISFASIPTCNSTRPDHGSNGAYPSWPAMALEAQILLNDLNTSLALSILASFANTTYEGPFGQARGAPQLSTPPYTPLNNQPAFKPSGGTIRYEAIEGGTFFDVVLRAFFGYNPPLLWTPNPTPESLLLNATISRQFNGALRNLRTPIGLVDIISNRSGLFLQNTS